MIDTHVHIWDTGRARYTWLDNEGPLLKRTYTIGGWEDAAMGTPVTGAVLVQAANNLEDTQLMLEASSLSALVKGVVGWAPLQQPDAVARLLDEGFFQNRFIKGFRHLIHNEADPCWLLQPPVLESLSLLAQKGLTYDVVGINSHHLRTALKVAEKVPGLFMVLDHLNQPPIAAGERFGEWGSLMLEASRHKMFYAKISGLGSPSGKPFKWTSDDIAPYLEFVLGSFGVDRCFCGGDWPVCLVNGQYAQALNNYITALGGLLDGEALQKVLTGNAEAFYKL